MATAFLRVVGVFSLTVIAVFAAAGGALLGAGLVGVLTAVVGIPSRRASGRAVVPIVAQPTAETAIYDVARAA